MRQGEGARHWRTWLGLVLLLALAACSTPTKVGGGAAGRDGPPPAGSGPEASQTTPVEPRVEPIRAGGPNKPYEVAGQTYVPMTSDEPLAERGLASWYGNKFHGRRTASGESYNMHAMTAAHKTMPIPSYARVRNPDNGREVIVRVNDRGPFVAGRVIDLSWAAAVQLGVQKGVSPVEITRLTHEDIRAGLWRQAPGATLALAPEPAAGPSTSASAATLPVVEPPKAGPTSASEAPERARALTSAAGGYWLQLGAFSKHDGAVSFRQRVAQELDWLAPLMTIFSEAGLHRLQAGPYPSREQAKEVAARLRESLQLVPTLVERR